MKMLLFIVVLAILPAAAAPQAEAVGLDAPLPARAFPYLATVEAAPAAGQLGQAAADERLAYARGRAGAAPSASLDGVVGANSATNVSTGANLINGGAFANMSGLPVVIQNSGANVLIQNATVINLQMR